MGVLGVSDEDFWVDPFRDREGALDRLAVEGLMGLALDGPSSVRLDLRDDAPVAGARRELTSAGLGYHFRERAVLVVARAESNEVFAARAFAWKEPVPVVEEEPTIPVADADSGGETEPFLDAVMTDFFCASLRERVPSLPWRAGTLRVTLVADDERSNTVVVRLEDAPVTDPAVAEFIARHRSPGYPRAVFPPASARDALPSYRARADSPPAPSVTGVALEAPARVGPGDGLVVRGSFALPLLAREVVKPFDAHLDRFGRLSNAGWVDVGDRDATAVVPVTLVITAERPDEPAVVRLDVPVYGPASPGDVARGFFAVDLRPLAAETLRMPGRYRLWALSGEVLVGPRAVEVVDAG